MSMPLRALIVEDSEDDTLLLVGELERGGYDVKFERVESAEAVTSALAGRTWDIIFADYTMPHFRGTDALELLKKSGLDIPFIFVSGTIGEDTAVEAMKAGAHDYVLKGNLKRLLPATERELREAKVRRERKRMEVALAQKISFLRLLQTVTAAANQATSAEDALQSVLDEVCAHTGWPVGHIYVPTEDSSNQLEPTTIWHLEDPKRFEVFRKVTETTSFTRGIGLPGRVLASGKPAWIFDVTKDPNFPRAKLAKDIGVRAGFAFPVLVGTEVVVVLEFFSSEAVEPDQPVLDIMADVGTQLGRVIERKRAQEQVQRNVERIRALHEIDLAISSTLDLRTVLDILLEKMGLFLPYAAALLYLLDRESGSLERAASRNLSDGEWKGRKFGIEGNLEIIPSLPKTVIEDKAPVIVSNTQTDPRILDHEFFRRQGLVSYMGVPLVAKGEALGVLSVLTREEHQFSTEERDFLTTLAGQAAIAIHNSQLYEQTKKQAVELGKSNKVKDEFLSVMSHELRTPLSVVMGYTGMIKDKMLGGINPRQEEALDKVMVQLDEQLDMVNNIIYATTLGVNVVKVDSHEANLREFLDNLRADYGAPLEKELTFTWNYPPDLPFIKTDSAKLKRILQNLIHNAIKFTGEKGSVTISVRIKPDNRQFVEFKVADTGIGIPKESLPIIFEKFRQVDSSETRLYGGVGMGLHIVKQFTEMLGGKVEVESEPAKGSTFTVTLPY